MSVALVTGASRGIGRAIAERLAGDGFDVFLVARSAENLRDTVQALAPHAGRVMFAAVDLSAAAAAGQVWDAFSSAFDRLDVLVNNAGVAMSRSLGEYDEHDWDSVMNVNVRAPFFLTQYALPYLKAANPGYVINIGSVVSKKGYEKQALYAASKHALLGFTKSLARETVSDGIRAHAILPGGVNTRLVTDVRPDIETSELIEPGEVAQVVCDLLRMRGNAVIDEIEIRRRTKTPWA